jgi:hypothetical protein
MNQVTVTALVAPGRAAGQFEVLVTGKDRLQQLELECGRSGGRRSLALPGQPDLERYY